jgi:hypothetical protein
MNARLKALAAAGLLGLTLTGSIAAGSTPALAKSDVYSAWYGDHPYDPNTGYGLGPLSAVFDGLVAPASMLRPATRGAAPAYSYSYDSHRPYYGPSNY